MTGQTFTCPRINPDTGIVCARPLDPDATFGPCPCCRAAISRRWQRDLHDRLVRVQEHLDAGYVIDEDNQFVYPNQGDDTDDVIAGDRAGAPSRRR